MIIRLFLKRIVTHHSTSEHQHTAR